MRLGILGGSFDPPHVGHLLAASDAFDALELDRLVFIPAGRQPFKHRNIVAPSADRLAMLRLTVNDDVRFDVDPMELGREGLSYTVDTLTTLAERDSVAERFLLVGADIATQIASWRQPERIAELAQVVILARPGAPEAPLSLGIAGARPAQRLASRLVDVSSTEIRERVRAGRPIRGFVTDAVEKFIDAAGLYR